MESVQLCSDVIVGGDALHLVKGQAIVSRLLGVHDSLVMQKGRGERVEYREGGHGDVGELELDVLAAPGVWQGFEHLPQLVDEMAGEVLHSPADSRK